MKIAIVGCPGSGKSVLAHKLHTILGIPLYHLDQYFWKPGWQEIDRDEFVKIHNQLCDKPEWIIDGTAIRLLEYRAQQADIIIFLDFPRYLCLYRFKRAITYFGKVYFASAKGCPERGPDPKFLSYIWTINRQRKPIVMDVLQRYKDQKKTFVIKNTAELDQLIKKFEADAL